MQRHRQALSQSEGSPGTPCGQEVDREGSGSAPGRSSLGLARHGRPGAPGLRWVRTVLTLLLLASAAAVQAAAFSLKVGDLLAANYGGNSVLKIDAASGAVQSLGTFVTPTDLALAPNGDLYISEFGGYLYRLTLTNGVLELINPSTLMYAVWGLLIEPATGDLIVTCGANDTVVRVDPTTGAETVISETNNLSGVSGIAWLDAGHVVVCSTFNNLLVEVALADGTQTPIATTGPGIDMPRGVAVFGTNIFMTAFDSREVRRVPKAGGEVTTFFTAVGFPFGMAVETNGNVITGTSGAAMEILRVSPGGALLRSYTDPLISEVTGVVVSPLAMVAAGLTNGPPTFDPLPDQEVAEDVLLTFDALATDTDWPPQTLTFSLDPGAPTGAVISPSGVFSWIPTEAQGPTNCVITVRVADDGDPALSVTQNFSVTVHEVNTRPGLALTNQTVAEGDLLSFTVAATDVDLPPQTLAVELAGAVPAGATLSPAGLFTWTPGETNGGNVYVIKVKAVDNGTPPLAVTNSFTVTVQEVNQRPTWSPIAPQSVFEGSFLTFALAAQDADYPTQSLTYALVPGGGPSGVAVSANGTFSWTPAENQGPGTNTILVRVTDNGVPSLSATQALVVVVNEMYLQCSPQAGGLYQDDPTALIDKTARTISVSRTASPTCFYRLRCNLPVSITRIRLNGNQVLLEYQFL